MSRRRGSRCGSRDAARSARRRSGRRRARGRRRCWCGARAGTVARCPGCSRSYGPRARAYGCARHNAYGYANPGSYGTRSTSTGPGHRRPARAYAAYGPGHGAAGSSSARAVEACACTVTRAADRLAAAGVWRLQPGCFGAVFVVTAPLGFMCEKCGQRSTSTLAHWWQFWISGESWTEKCEHCGTVYSCELKARIVRAG